MLCCCSNGPVCPCQDDEAALLAELARIRKERAEEAQRKAAQEAAERQEALQQEVATGNPLLNQPVDFQVWICAVADHNHGIWLQEGSCTSS